MKEKERSLFGGPMEQGALVLDASAEVGRAVLAAASAMADALAKLENAQTLLQRAIVADGSRDAILVQRRSLVTAAIVAVKNAREGIQRV